MNEPLKELENLIAKIETRQNDCGARHEGESPWLNVIRQFVIESCEYAWCVADSIRRQNYRSAGSNLRPIIERWVAWDYFTKYADSDALSEWEHFGIMDKNSAISAMQNAGLLDKTEHTESRETQKALRRWNRDLDTGIGRQLKISENQWRKHKQKMWDEATPLDQALFHWASTLSHPTYRGSEEPVFAEQDEACILRHTTQYLARLCLWYERIASAEPAIQTIQRG